MRYAILTLSLASLLAACDSGPTFTEAEPGEHLSAGEGTVTKVDQNAFSLPLANLSPTRRVGFSVGNSFFRNPWVIAPASTDARDGLGPLFNTNACQNCHIKDGRGHPPGPEAKQAVSMLVRLSVPAGEGDDLTRSGLVAEPNYGGQFQDAAIPGVAPEGRVRVEYSPLVMRFADGHEVELRKPRLTFSNLGYGQMHPATLFSA
ncbi:MAG: di-heme oxidoredictase family protein, partial [Alcanivorax nanhaiticus]